MALGKFTDTQVEKMRNDYASGKKDVKAICKETKCTNSTIYSILTGKCYRNSGGSIKPLGRLTSTGERVLTSRKNGRSLRPISQVLSENQVSDSQRHTTLVKDMIRQHIIAIERLVMEL